jgi:hypothetical protein
MSVELRRSASALPAPAREIATPGGSRTPAVPVGRQCVLWLGGEPPADLVAAVAGRGWGLRPVSAEELSDGAPLRTARGLVIEVSDAVIDADNADTFAARATSHIDAALTSGVPVTFVPAECGDRLSAARVQRFCYVVEPLTQPSDTRVTFRMREWGSIAGWIEAHPPGPAASYALHLDGDLPTEHEPEAEHLLRRAFHDAERVTLTRIAGGKSGAAVWSATPHASDAQHRASPFLVKFNTLAKTRVEQSRYAQYADERVSFRLRPPIHRARCVHGRTHGLLVFDFIERAVPFRAALTTYAPGQLVGSLFGHTLAGCLRNGRDVMQRLEPAFTRIKVLNWSEALDEVAAVVCASDAALPDAAEVREIIESLPPMAHRVAIAHGDLHTGNLLVAAGSSDVLLIDFGSIEFGMPVATDPACLEVSLTFAPEEARNELGGRTAPAADADWLREAYRYPLEPFAVPDRYGRESWVADAVRAIRGVVRQLEPTTAAFAVATASYLFRYASYPDNGSAADRALAYELAAKLIIAVQAEAGTGTDQEHKQNQPGMVGESTAAA